jgi:hypothetical protein
MENGIPRIIYTDIKRTIQRPRSTHTPDVASTEKKEKGQFYTTQSDYILDGLFECIEPHFQSASSHHMIEPFAGKGDLVEWFMRKWGSKTRQNNILIETYDIDPKYQDTVKRDTLVNPPEYKDTWIITNPPYLARNKCPNKALFDQYATNDLYKCFITTFTKISTKISTQIQDQTSLCKGGIMIVPAGFFFSPRDVDVRCRNAFMCHFRILRVNYFEETVFQDTSTTVVAVAFIRHEDSAHPLLTTQSVSWTKYPSKETRVFEMSKHDNWIIGGDIYRIGQNLVIQPTIHIRRHVIGNPLKPDEQQTNMTLTAVDSGSQSGRIKLEYTADYIYPAQECSRTYATLRIRGRHLSPEDQEKTCKEFNEFIETRRTNTWSLFLPQFRESKEYARKRIPFELAYGIIEYIVSRL